jgi:hypothetical protein
LDFKHHDAGEDARASAEVVLLAEADRTISPAPRPIKVTGTETSDDFDVIESA